MSTESTQLTSLPQDVLNIIIEFLDDVDVPALFICCKGIHGSGCIAQCDMDDSRLPIVTPYTRYLFTGRGYRTATRCHPRSGKVRVEFSELIADCEFRIVNSAASGLIVVSHWMPGCLRFYMMSADSTNRVRRLLYINHAAGYLYGFTYCTLLQLQPPRRTVYDIISMISLDDLYILESPRDDQGFQDLSAALEPHGVTVECVRYQYHNDHIRAIIERILDQ